ncbi:ribonuclease D [Pseudomonas psychrotolerans]|nr:ribonuclease D [Pseudomonas psychrotolerans]
MTSAPHWIRDDAALAALCQRCQSLPFIALDTEFMRVDTFYPKAGLIQIGDGEQAYLVDPLCISDWTPFAALLEDPKVVKVLHACSEDLEVLLRLTGSLPQPLYDTQLAAAYLGLAHSMGYSRLVAEVLQIDLPKDETRSDWLQRPLTPLQERYAAADVTHLAEVYRQLDARLDERRRAWLLEDGADLVANLRRTSDPWEAYREVKLAWRLSRQQLAVLRVLCHWRELTARERDQPRNHVLRERSLWPLARFQPTDKQALARIDDMHPRTVRQDWRYPAGADRRGCGHACRAVARGAVRALAPRSLAVAQGPARHRRARRRGAGHGAGADAAQEGTRSPAAHRLARRRLPPAR